ERQIGVPRPVQGHILQRVPEVGPVGGIPQEAVVRVGLIDGSEGGRAGLGGGPGGIGGGVWARGAVANIDIARNAKRPLPISLQCGASAVSSNPRVRSRRLATGTSGEFKVPSLRNVELTGPYMQNGSMATLAEVLQFYNRGGNFASPGKDVQVLFSARAGRHA